MNIFVLDTNLNAVFVLDTYKSFIWTERYHKYGDFEIYTLVSNDILKYLRRDYYLQRGDSDRAMIIEDIVIKSDVEEGNSITVTGRSLESILDRRIIWGQKTISGNLQEAIKTLLEENIISPSDPNRKVSNFIFEATDDPSITSLTIEAQYTGDNLYTVIENICGERGIGFKVYMNDSKQFVFTLYAGEDRSYDQIKNPYVIFSPHFENLLNSNYAETNSSLKNVTLVGGEGEGTARKYASVGTVSGLDRRELFTDARDISSDVGDGVILTDEEYTAQLEQRGNEKLSENTVVTSFEGEIETTIMFKYGRDFFNGDIIQIENEYGHQAKARILEIVTSENDDGVYIYPTFSTIEDEQKGEEETI